MSIVDGCVLLVCSGAVGLFRGCAHGMGGTGRRVPDGSSGWHYRAPAGTAERTSGERFRNQEEANSVTSHEAGGPGSWCCFHANPSSAAYRSFELSNNANGDGSCGPNGWRCWSAGRVRWWRGGAGSGPGRWCTAGGFRLLRRARDAGLRPRPVDGPLGPDRLRARPRGAPRSLPFFRRWRVR